MLENQLKQLGFSKNETKVYLALFDIGKCKAGQIIENTGLHRNLVYTALDELVNKGLVAKVIKNGIATFFANSPELLLSMVEEQKNIAQEIVDTLKKKNEVVRDIVVYEGEEGIKRSRNRALQYDAGETLYVLGSQASSTPEMERYWRQFHLKREKQGINFKMMYESGVNPSDLEWRNNLKLSEAKYLPEQIDFPVWFAFIKDYLEIGIPGDDPLTFGLRSKEAVAAFKQFFNYFWNQETQILKGREVLKDLWLEGVECKEMRWIGARGYFMDAYPELFKEIKKKAENTLGVVWKNVVEENVKGHPITKLPWAQTKYSLPKTKNPVVIWLFGNKVLVVNWAEGEPIIFCSTNKTLVQSYSDYFDELWERK